jgi:bifunctional DNA-binding transcriptional regulator/antitoxin component of YhaV-PrlF toxin-antitoxin module
MTATGMIRAVDALGRVVIPKEFRHMLNWDPEASKEARPCGTTGES